MAGCRRRAPGDHPAPSAARLPACRVKRRTCPTCSCAPSRPSGGPAGCPGLSSPVPSPSKEARSQSRRSSPFSSPSKGSSWKPLASVPPLTEPSPPPWGCVYRLRSHVVSPAAFSRSFFFFFIFYLFMIVTEREREAETQAEGEAGSPQGTRCGHTSPGYPFHLPNPRPASSPERKAAAQPLSHPGVRPSFPFSYPSTFQPSASTSACSFISVSSWKTGFVRGCLPLSPLKEVEWVGHQFWCSCVRVDLGFPASACLACFPRLLHDLDSREVAGGWGGGDRVLISLDHLLGPIPRGIFLMG